MGWLRGPAVMGSQPKFHLHEGMETPEALATLALPPFVGTNLPHCFLRFEPFAEGGRQGMLPRGITGSEGPQVGTLLRGYEPLVQCIT